MQTVETKTSSTASNQIQKKQQSFFNKKGEGSFFSKSNEIAQPFFSPNTIQPKLTIGQPKDKYEVEADAMADKVVQRLSTNNESVRHIGYHGNTAIQTKCDSCEEQEKLQKKEEPLANEINSVQLKPIFESNAEQPESDVQTKPISSPVIQAKCSSCEEEKLQKKEDDFSQHGLDVQRKPTFESNAEQPEADIQSKPISAPVIQTKCSSCEQEEKLQMKEEEEISEPKSCVQAKSMDGGLEAHFDLQSKLNASRGGGSALPSDIQSSMGSEFGADFSNVRVHTGSNAIQMSKDIGAQAFTHGNDIYFNQGKYDTSSPSGKHLLAHELTHTVQQGSSSISPSVQKEDDACYPEDMENESLTCEVDYSEHETILNQNGINLDNQDLIELAGLFPEGIRLNSQELFVLVHGESLASSIRVSGFRVTTSAPVNSGVSVFIFQIGKGRSIMVSSRVGGSIMLDAGAGTSRTSNSVKAHQIARDVRNILRSGLSAPPSRITISHVDLDHYNAVQQVLNVPEMRGLDVRISRQQLMEAVRSGNWQTMNIQLNRPNRLVRINVSGSSGVHIDRAFIGGMEITEFRSVSAHEQLTDTSRRTYNKNSTSEVTVVRDFLTNTTHVFTGDGEGKTLHEIINMVGREAFRRIIGGGSRNLASVEAPHHGGAVTSGPNTRGMIEFVRLAFEASNGSVNFFTQTSARFSGTESASINYLSAVEVPVQRVQEGTNTENTTQVRRISGQTQEQITIDRGRITEILNIGNVNASRVMEAQQARSKLASLVELVAPVQRMLAIDGTRAEFRQLGEAASGIKTNIQTGQTSINTTWNAFWEVMLAEASSNGMRQNTPTAQVTRALTRLRTQVQNTEITQFENDVRSLYNGLNIYQRLLTNALAMTAALNEGRLGDLRTLKAEQRNLIGRSVGILGRAEVSSQVRQAWKTIRQVWTGRMIRSVARRLGGYSAAHRHMMNDYRTVLNENIVNQARLKQLVEMASHGALPRTGSRPVPMRTRMGAGLMAAIEVMRIGLEFYEALEASEAAEKIRENNDKVEGLQTINWWQRMGAQPSIALVKRGTMYGWNTVSDHLSNSAKYEILNDNYNGEIPEFDKAVVTSVSDENLEYVVGKMTLELITINDWVDRFGHPETGNGAIKKFNNGWGVKLWNEEDGSYQYYLEDVIQEPLDELYILLQENLETELKHEATDPENSLGTVDDTAIFGTDRYVYVYNGSGTNLKRIDFEERAPKFFIGGALAPTNSDLISVRAADRYTYNILSKYYTIEIHDGVPYNTVSKYRNSQGIGFIQKDDVLYDLSNLVNQTLQNIDVQRKPIFESNEVTPKGQLQKKCAACSEEEEIQRKGNGAEANTTGIENQLNSSLGSGNSLNPEVQQEMGTVFGNDFSGVRIHTDSNAAEMSNDIGAQAFTHGNDIYFNQGKYEPKSTKGKHLLAHELTHTLQQSASKKSKTAPNIQKEDNTAGMTSTEAPMTVRAEGPEQPVPFAQTLPSGQRVECPILPGVGAIIFRGTPLSSDSDYLRYVLEEQVKENGREALTDYPKDFESFVREEIERLRDERRNNPSNNTQEQFAYDYYDSDIPGSMVSAGVPAQQYEYISQELEQLVRPHREILSELRTQATSIGQEIDTLFQEFEVRARLILGTLLDESASRVEQEAIRYGLADQYDGQSYHNYSVMENATTLGLQGAAQDVLDATKIYQDAHDARFDPNLGYATPTQAHIDRLNANLEEARTNLDGIKASAETRYPIIGAFTRDEGETAELRRIANGTGNAHLIGRTINDRRTKIARVRVALGNNQIDVWKHRKIVQLAMADMGVQSDSMHSNTILANYEEHSRTPIIEWVLIGVALALGLLAAAPTGGGSLGVALSATAALGAAGINTYLLVEHLQDYEEQSNLSGTDFGLARSISQNSPSEFWLAVEIASLGLDVAAVFQAFGHLAPLARQAGRAGEEGIQGMNALRQSGDELQTGLGRRLADSAASLRRGGDEALDVAGTAGRNESRALARAGARIGEDGAEIIARVATREGVRTVKITANGHVVLCLNPCGWMREVFSEALSENADLLRQVEEIEQMGIRLREGNFLPSESATSLRSTIRSRSERVLMGLEDIEMAKMTGVLVRGMSVESLRGIAVRDPSMARYLMARQLAASEEITTIHALELLDEFGVSTDDLLRRIDLAEARLGPEPVDVREAGMTQDSLNIVDEQPYAASTRNDPTQPNQATGMHDVRNIDDPTIIGDHGEYLTVGEYVPNPNVQTQFTHRFSRARRIALRRILTDGEPNAMTRFAARLGENGGSQITLMTEFGPRVVDYLRVQGARALMVESKQVQTLSLTRRLQRQLLKDEWFLRQYPDLTLRWRVSGTITPEVEAVFQRLAREYSGRFIYP
jgi:hypothetical protein